MTAAEACGLVVDLTRELAIMCSERESYRLLSRQAIHLLHERHVELECLRARHHRLLDEYRSYRAATIATPSRAA